MAGRTLKDAYKNYRDPLKRVISCVTDAVLIASVQPNELEMEEIYSLVLQSGDAVPLSGDSRISISVSQQFSLIKDDRQDYGPYRVSTSAYSYVMEEIDGPEILAYHWHPRGVGKGFPHLHLKSGAKVQRPELTRSRGESSHIPTGRVAIEEFVRLLIECFNVPPRKSNWEDELKETKQKFDEFKNW